MMASGESTEQASLGSGTHTSDASSGSGHLQSPSTAELKAFIGKFAEPDRLTEKLHDFFFPLPENSVNKILVPFKLQELQDFDYALEGVSFEKSIQMPNVVHASASASDAVEAEAYLALEDFLYEGAKGLWETFWVEEGPMPLQVGSLHSKSSKFYPAQKVIANGKAGGLCATALFVSNGHHPYGKWEDILEVALLRPDVVSLSLESDRHALPSVLGEALFFAARVLLSRNLNRYNLMYDSSFIYILIVDSQHGGVVKLEGDVSKFEVDVNHVYECAADWIKMHCQIKVSPVHRVWNELGDADWGDVGSLQILLATYNTMALTMGPPKISVANLTGIHLSHPQSPRDERQLVETHMNVSGAISAHQKSSEIVEVRDESVDIEPDLVLRLEVGSVVWLEDFDSKKGFQINEVLQSNGVPVYISISLDDPGKSMLLYVGSHPSQLGPSWKEINLWYQVQRQTKVLSVMKQKGLSSKYLPQLVASGRIVHSDQCWKQTSIGHCRHPWCGTPILATYPVGDLVSNWVKRCDLTCKEVLRLCHDCLCAIGVANSAGIQHGDICPENIVRATAGTKHHFVLVGWGRAILEDRDRAARNLFFSSTCALQEGKLCPSSDTESLIYVLFFVCGGFVPELDSVEAALHWRVLSWSRRSIQQKLGEVSTVLKAFADYIDSLCGTPYSVDYEIWLTRLSKSLYGASHGKERQQINSMPGSSGATASSSFS